MLQWSRAKPGNPASNTITSMALKSSEARAQKRNKTKSVIIFKSLGHTGVIISLRGRQLFKVEKQFWRDKFWIFYGKRQDFLTRFQCGWEFIPNDGCSNRESTRVHVQFSSRNRQLLWGRWSELSGDVRKVQETSHIRWLMYCKARYVRVDSLNLIL